MNLDVQDLRNRVLQLQGRLELHARREKALEALLAEATSDGPGRADGGERGRAARSTSSWPRSRTATRSRTRRSPSRRTCAALGYASDIFAEGVHPRMAHLARPLWQYPDVSSPETVCLFHFSIGSAAGRLTFHAPDRLVAIYHNITPAHFFLGFHPHLAGLCYHGRRELEAFAPADRAGARRQRVQPPRAGGRPASRGRASCRSCWTSPRTSGPPSPVVRRLYADGRQQRRLRRPHHPEQAHRRPDPHLRALPAAPRAAQPAAAGGRPPRPRALLRPPARAGRVARRAGGRLHRARRPRRAARVLRAWPTLSCACPSTRASACRCWRRWSSACR